MGTPLPPPALDTEAALMPFSPAPMLEMRREELTMPWLGGLRERCCSIAEWGEEERVRCARLRAAATVATAAADTCIHACGC